MNAARASFLIGSAMALALAAAPAITQAQSSPKVANPPSAANPVPVYNPPLRGAPTSRVGGASRGPKNGELELIVLAPESTGLTSRTQPTLYWYSSKSLSSPLEFTLNDERSVKPLVELKVSVPQPGIHALRLNYTLKPEVEYQWSIAAVADPNQRASDTIASGTLKRVQLPAMLADQLNRASKRELLFLYAREGFWYDAIAILSEQIDANPADRDLREQRAVLLAQVKLIIQGCSKFEEGCSLKDALVKSVNDQ